VLASQVRVRKLGFAMGITLRAALTALAIITPLSAAHAASCSDDIDRMQARIDARIEAIAAAGPFVPTSVSAGMGVQPTPFGIATVEERMGELSRNNVDAVRDAMAQARAANAAGNRKACEKALTEVRHIVAH
jgi:hypothetical protein